MDHMVTLRLGVNSHPLVALHLLIHFFFSRLIRCHNPACRNYCSSHRSPVTRKALWSKTSMGCASILAYNIRLLDSADLERETSQRWWHLRCHGDHWRMLLLTSPFGIGTRSRVHKKRRSIMRSLVVQVSHHLLLR